MPRPSRRSSGSPTFDAPARPAGPPRGPITEPLSLSFYQIDDYLTCPLKYKYAHVLRVPLAPHHAIVYGAALHKAVQLFHHRHARGHVMSEAELDEVFDSAWSNEGFVSREHEEARLRGRPGGAAPVPGGAARAGCGHPDLRRAGVQLHASVATGSAAAGTGSTSCRSRTDRRRRPPGAVDTAGAHADVVSPTLGILGPERVTITDYKSSDVRDPAKARQRARDSLQLQIYAMGYEAMTGRLPDALALHFLESGLVGEVAVDPKRLAKAREKIADGSGRDAGPRLHAEARPPACTYCAFRDICPASVAR